MVQIQSNSTISVPTVFAFDYVTDFTLMPEWLYGIQEIRCINDIPSGVGARYEGAIKVGATLRSSIEIIAHEPNRLLATESRAGIVNQSTWRFRERSDEQTEIHTTIDYELPGGLAGRVLAKAIEPFISIAVASTERNLRSILESRFQALKR
ncbi:cyclase/dehydrase [Mycobacteroides abscessus subsp. abscessus]|nr:cyclase/dehydrase [Mycobacteroides abscessus subsp. abscessus]